jgi:hypothetical protein
VTTPPGTEATPRLHQAFGVCEECYEAEEFGTTPPHADGHCWTAADLLAYPALRQPSAAARMPEDGESLF